MLGEEGVEVGGDFVGVGVGSGESYFVGGEDGGAVFIGGLGDVAAEPDLGIGDLDGGERSGGGCFHK